MQKVMKIIKEYRNIKADIINIGLKIQELDNEMLGVGATPSGERTGETYKINSTVEIQLEKYLEYKSELLKEMRKKEIIIQRIDNAMTVLGDIEKDIIEIVLINNKRYRVVEAIHNLTYVRLKQLEAEALKKMEKYILW